MESEGYFIFLIAISTSVYEVGKNKSYIHDTKENKFEEMQVASFYANNTRQYDILVKDLRKISKLGSYSKKLIDIFQNSQPSQENDRRLDIYILLSKLN